jgi:C1A family cysteine protease
MRILGTDYILSPEQVIQCDKTSEGCNGGWTEHAYEYLINAGGQQTESTYPYTSYAGSTGTCKVNSKDFVVSVTSYTTITGSSVSVTESNMAAYVQNTGPLSVCLDASTWSTYTGGTMSAATCGTSVDHCVQAVGVDASTGGYWKVRNQWGTSWGLSGFIQLAYGTNTCDITNDPTHVVVKA